MSEFMRFRHAVLFFLKFHSCIFFWDVYNKFSLVFCQTSSRGVSPSDDEIPFYLFKRNLKPNKVAGRHRSFRKSLFAVSATQATTRKGEESKNEFERKVDKTEQLSKTAAEKTKTT